MSHAVSCPPLPQVLAAAAGAAQRAGALLRANQRAAKKVHLATQHDIKLELDVRCQRLIEGQLRRAFPNLAVLGEEGVRGDPQAPARWVVDPIDGTVNFTYGIPHCCVSIAFQARLAGFKGQGSGFQVPDAPAADDFQTLVGVVYDPFCDELWTAVRGGPARLNGRRIAVSTRTRLAESIISIGFAKERATLAKMLPAFNNLVHRVRKIRIMGAAALGLAYVASGRMDAYVEHGLGLWDIAAGGLLIECAGGAFLHRLIPGSSKYSILASNGRLRRQLQPLVT